MILHCHRWALVLPLVILPLAQSSAQVKPGTTITGRVSDEETGNPLENVIAFLSNTPIGTSSERDGTFRIIHVPAGTYELVLSCVGYGRQTLAIAIERPDSLYYEIKLKPKPVETTEVEILGQRPGGTAGLKLGGLLFPKDSTNAYRIYGTSNTPPIGIFVADSGLYMYSLEPVTVKEEKYMRVWLLYRNYSQTPYDLDPSKHVKLHMKGRKYVYRRIEPDRSAKILESVKNEDAVRQSEMMIGHQLQGVGEKDNFIKSETVRSLIEGTEGPPDSPVDPALPLFIYFIAECGKDVGKYSGTELYDDFKESVNDGILKRHLVYPNNSVNGYIYFPFPGMDYKASGTGFPEAFEYIYEMEVLTSLGSKTIEFTPGGL